MIELQIDNLSVRNYRCISKMQLDKFSPITVFVGRNNTGKSALLEAIALVATAKSSWCDSLGDDLIEPIIDRRGGMQFADMMIKIGEQSAELSATNDKGLTTVEIAKDTVNLSEALSSQIAAAVAERMETITEDYSRRIRRASEDSDISLRGLEEIYREIDTYLHSIMKEAMLYVGCYDENGEIRYALVLGQEWRDRFRRISRGLGERALFRMPYPIENIIRSSPKEKSNTIFLLTPTIQYLKELQRRLARSGELLSVIDRMRRKISYFQDIREVKDDFLVFLKGLDRSVPLAAMGDGFRAKLAILSAISTVREGIALMEEPETRLHPGYMSSVVNEIVTAADHGNLQFFLSTHNLEFIELMLEENVELVRIVRMYRQEDKAEIDYEVLEGQEAKENLKQLKLDLRGV